MHLDSTRTATLEEWARWLGVPPVRGAEGDPPPGSGNATAGDPAGGTVTTTTDSTTNTTTPPRTFTQDEVNALLAREVDKAKRGKLDPSELGFGTKKELEEFLTEAKTRAEAAKTEQEKAIEAARKEGADAAKAELLPRVLELATKAEFKVRAVAAGVAADRVDKSYLLARALPEWEEVKIEGDTVLGLDDNFFKALKTDSPFLFEGASGNGSGDIGAGAGGGKNAAAREAELRERYGALNR